MKPLKTPQNKKSVSNLFYCSNLILVNNKSNLFEVINDDN